MANWESNDPAQPQLAPCLPGFEHIKRYWEPKWKKHVAIIHPGQLYVTKESEVIVTTLGSCISACIRDKELNFGGMNHFMLPLKGNVHDSAADLKDTSEAARYGNWAMELLVNELLKLGATRRNLEIKIFGGANINNMTQCKVSEKNIEFVHQFIHNDNLNLIAEDVGSNFARKVAYHPFSGKVKMQKIISDVKVIKEQEDHYMSEINSNDNDGDVELF